MEAGSMSAETVAPPAAVDQDPADRDPVAAAAEARRLSRPGIRPPDGWPDDE